ncbi:hypothetical protein AX16_007641 [Volvariella volvacea WC 439]|nr:hypothetical protein AX16_007641 [Volvariella volvacea WC 439]
MSSSISTSSANPRTQIKRPIKPPAHKIVDSNVRPSSSDFSSPRSHGSNSPPVIRRSPVDAKSKGAHPGPSSRLPERSAKAPISKSRPEVHTSNNRLPKSSHDSLSASDMVDSAPCQPAVSSRTNLVSGGSKIPKAIPAAARRGQPSSEARDQAHQVDQKSNSLGRRALTSSSTNSSPRDRPPAPTGTESRSVESSSKKVQSNGIAMRPVQRYPLRKAPGTQSVQAKSPNCSTSTCLTSPKNSTAISHSSSRVAQQQSTKTRKGSLSESSELTKKSAGPRHSGAGGQSLEEHPAPSEEETGSVTGEDADPPKPDAATADHLLTSQIPDGNAQPPSTSLILPPQAPLVATRSPLVLSPPGRGLVTLPQTRVVAENLGVPPPLVQPASPPSSLIHPSGAPLSSGINFHSNFHAASPDGTPSPMLSSNTQHNDFNKSNVTHVSYASGVYVQQPDAPRERRILLLNKVVAISRVQSSSGFAPLPFVENRRGPHTFYYEFS